MLLYNFLIKFIKKLYIFKFFKIITKSFFLLYLYNNYISIKI